MEGGHGRRRPAARAARDPVEVPRVGRRAVGRVLGRAAHRELVHVGLAQDHRAGGTQALGDVGVVRRPIALEDPRAGGALATLDRDQVLERDRQAVERRQGGQGSRPVAPSGDQRRRRQRRPAPGRPRRSIVSQACSPRLSRSAAARWASVSSRELNSPARRPAASSCPGRRFSPAGSTAAIVSRRRSGSR